MNANLQLRIRLGLNVLSPSRHSRAFSLLARPTLLDSPAKTTNPPWVQRYRQVSACRSLTLTRHSPYVRPLSFVGNRLFHTTTPRYMPPYPNQPPFKVYRISPIVAVLTGIGFLMLLFAVLPFIFTFFFPLIIAGICAYQFSKWKRKVLFQDILRHLKTSTMKVNYNTVKALHVKSLDKIVRLEQQNAKVFEDLLKSFDADLRARLDKFSSAKADKLLRFIDDRLLEAIETNEQGIRNYFLGDDVGRWVEDNYQLELDTTQYKTNAQVVDGELIMLLVFPLYLKSNSNPRKHLANVSLALLQGLFEGMNGANYLEFLSSISETDAECQMVIAVQPVTNFSTKLFVISTDGRSGDWYSKYDSKEDSDGHTEYTVKSNN